MSIISKIEVSNFLNLDNVEPFEQNWSAHYPHLVINCRGTNTIIQLSNGGGKSTITNAILLLLSRHQNVHSRVKKILAPKRMEIYTHIRLEVRHRERHENLLPGLIEGIPGEPYVIGMYGYHDKNEGPDFYIYQGTLEDCPSAHTRFEDNEIVIDFVTNNTFTETLKKQRHYQPRNKAEYLTQVYQHFDEKLIGQLLQYQQLGGGDGTSNFFNIDKTEHNHAEDFSTRFFYEHLAPEVLMDCMRQSGEEDERAFEDTLIYSSTKVIDIEVRQAEADKQVADLNYTFEWLNEACTKIHEYESKRDDLNRKYAELWHELKFIKNCVIDNPLPCVPLPIKDAASELTLKIANNLIYLNGNWLFMDALIGHVFNGLSPKDLNQIALRKKVENTPVKVTQVIEIPCDLSFLPNAQGHESKAYNFPQMMALMSHIEPRFYPTDLDLDALKRQINQAYNLRVALGEINPFRQQDKEASHSLEGLKKKNEEAQENINALALEMESHTSKLQHFAANETAYLTMAESRLFSAEQLSQPLVTGHSIDEHSRSAFLQLEKLNDQNALFGEGRAAYQSVAAEFGSHIRPEHQLSLLEAECRELSGDFDDVYNQLLNIGHELIVNEKHMGDLQETLNNYRETEIILLSQQRSYEALSIAYSAVEMPTLATKLQQDLDDCISRYNSQSLSLESITRRQEKLVQLEQIYQTYTNIFGDTKATGLKSSLEKEQAELKWKLHGANKDLPVLENEFENLKKLHQSFNLVEEAFNEIPVPIERLSGYLLERKIVLSNNLEKTQSTILDMEPLVKALQEYSLKYEIDIESAIQSHKEHFNKLRREEITLKEKIIALEEKLIIFTSAKIAPLSLSQKALSEINFKGDTLQSFICRSNLSQDHKQSLLISFSQLLHAPVAANRSQGEEMVNKLHQADLDYPVFEQTAVEAWLLGNTTDVQNLLIGTETLQVKAIINPHYIPQLIEDLKLKINNLFLQREELDSALNEYDLENDRYTLLKQAKKATNVNAVQLLDESIALLDQYNNELLDVEEYIACEAYIKLPQAIEFEFAGGKNRMVHVENIAEEMRLQIILNKNRFSIINNLLSHDNVIILDSATDFELEGGSAEVKNCISIHATTKTSFEKSLSDYEIAKIKYGDYYHLAQEVASFLAQGGLERLSLLKSDIVKFEAGANEKQVSINKNKELINYLEKKKSELFTRKSKSDNTFFQWKVPLTAAQLFLDKNGPDFDASFEPTKLQIQQQLETLKEQLKINFQAAQAYVDMQENRIDRVKLIEALKSCKEKSRQASIFLRENNNKIENLQNSKLELQTNIKDYDRFTSAIIHKYTESADILLAIQDDFQITGIEPSAYLEPAMQLANNYREDFRKKDWISCIKNLEEFSDIINYFKYNDLQKSISQLKNEFLKFIDHIETYISKQRENDAGLRDGEREELSHKKRENLFSVIKTFKSTYEKFCIEAENKRDSLKKDVDQQKDNLSESLLALSSNIQDNFELMKKVLSPGRSPAGFYIDAEVIDRTVVRKRIDNLVDTIRMEEIARRKKKSEAKEKGIRIATDKEYMKDLKRLVKDNFYRSVFIGGSNEGAPTMEFMHPCLAGGKKKKLTNNLSTGQKTALSLLLLTKLAEFASERDLHVGMISMNRNPKRKAPHNKVVLIDGLFSNLSDAEMINFSLETVKLLKDKFQLIGWVHNPDYRNNHEIFPTFHTISRIDKRGRYMRVKDLSQVSSSMTSAGLFIDQGPDNDRN